MDGPAFAVKDAEMDSLADEVIEVPNDEEPMMPDPDYEDIQNELDTIRRQYAIYSYSNPHENNFYVQVLGGEFTWKRTGLILGSFVGSARTGLPLAWCRLFGIQLTMRFGLKIGKTVSHALAELFVHRCENLFMIWFVDGGQSLAYEYPPIGEFAYTEPAHLVSIVEAAGLPALRRLLRIRAVYPASKIN